MGIEVDKEIHVHCSSSPKKPGKSVIGEAQSVRLVRITVATQGLPAFPGDAGWLRLGAVVQDEAAHLNFICFHNSLGKSGEDAAPGRQSVSCS
jgi:hypothetical protein